MDLVHEYHTLVFEDYVLAFVGWIAVNLFNLVTAKNKVENEPDFNLKSFMTEYSIQNIDDWAFSLIVTFAFLYIAPETYVWYMEVWTDTNTAGTTVWFSGVSLFIGAFGHMIFDYVYDKIKKLKGK